MAAFAVSRVYDSSIRHYERSEAIHSDIYAAKWIASSLALLAMTEGVMMIYESRRQKRRPA
jgi:hypothetical protein